MWRLDDRRCWPSGDDARAARLGAQPAGRPDRLHPAGRPADGQPGRVQPRRARIPRRPALRALLPAAASSAVQPVGRVWSFRDMTLHRQLEQELRAQAFTDPLTPLANRAYFIQRLTAALAAPGRPRPASRSLLLDLDDFKTRQRQPRPRGRRRPADRGRRAAAELSAPSATSPPGSAATSSWCCCDRLKRAGGRGLRRRAAARRRCRAAAGRGPALTIRASIGIALPAPGDETPRTCCATPTWRCTPPSATAAAAATATPRRCTPRRWPGWRSRPTWNAPSSPTSWSCTTSRCWTCAASRSSRSRRWCAGRTRARA